MTERELTLFSAMTDIGDDLVLESTAFLPALGGAVGSAVGGTAAAASAGKRAAWVLPVTLASCAALVAAVGILVGVVGNALGFFPQKPPEVTTEEVVTDAPTDQATEEPTEESTEAPTEESTEETTEAPTEEDTEGPETEPEDEGPEYRVQANNYKLPFVIGYCSDSFDPNIYFDNTNSSPTYALGEAAYQRIKQTEKYLGVEITVTSAGNYQNYASKLLSSVMSGGSPYDMLLTHGSYGITDLMIANCLTDLSEQEGLNLKASYWDQAGMEALSVKGCRYLGAGDFLLPESSHVLAFNKRIAADLELDTHLYTLVRDHGWTLSKMAEYVGQYSSDNGDGKWDESDSFGLSCNVWTTTIPFMTASNIVMVKQSEGSPTIDWKADGTAGKVAHLDALLHELMSRRCAYTYSPIGGEPAVTISSDRIFMETVTLGQLPWSLTGDVDVGVLPYPLYDREQDGYKTLYMDGYVAVPNGIQRADMVADVVETLAYRSADLQAAYYDYLLGEESEERMMDSVMLETVRESLTYDPILYLYPTSTHIEKLMYTVPHHLAGVRGSADVTLTDALVKSASRDLGALLRSFAEE